jgi:probable O-glycosylation ligase (exosortase A-associated)
MRDIAVLLAIILAIGLTIPFPYVGVLSWAWFTLMNPHQEAYGFSRTAPLNLILSVVTIAVWLFSKERKLPPLGFAFWMTCIFILWMTFNSFFALDPDWSWPLWDRTWKIYALGLLVAATAVNKARIHALIWIIVASLGYYGVKGGIFTIMTGGHFHVVGPPATIIGDNNQLALALLMAIPLANYLRLQTEKQWIRLILLTAIVLSVVSVVGSYSRGGILGLGALVLASFFRTRRKLVYVLLATIVLIPVLYFMPDHFFHRVNTLNDISSDESFMGRVLAWRVAWASAVHLFPFGAGFSALQRQSIWQQYMPGEPNHAAHSIYFEVLGDHGFIGLAIYLAILISTFVTCVRLQRATKTIPQLRWVNDLTNMIFSMLVVFCVSGAGLSMAYYDLYVICTMLLLPLARLADDKMKEMGLGGTSSKSKTGWRDMDRVAAQEV